MCRVLRVARSGFYAWVHQPPSERAQEDRRLLALIRSSYAASGSIYGSPRIYLDLREDRWRPAASTGSLGSLRSNKIRGTQGYKVPRAVGGGPPSRRRTESTTSGSSAGRSGEPGVGDGHHVHTDLAGMALPRGGAMDLFARKIIGWSMKPSLRRELVVDALLMAVWRRRPERGTIVHLDQGSQYGSDDFQNFCRAHHLQPSMSRSRKLLGQRRRRVVLQQLEEGACTRRRSTGLTLGCRQADPCDVPHPHRLA